MPEITIENYMHFVNFDTHKYVKELESSGFNERQAEAIIKSLSDSRNYDISKLATKEQVVVLEKDVAIIRKDLSTVQKDVGIMQKEIGTIKQDIGVMQNEMTGIKQEIGAIHKSIATLEREIVNVKYDILK